MMFRNLDWFGNQKLMRVGYNASNVEVVETIK